MKSEKYVKELFLCNRCGYCRRLINPNTGTFGICPTYEVKGFESYTARGTINIARAIFERRLSIDKRLADHIFSKCLMCKNCQIHCPSQVDITLVTRTIRSHIFATGLLPEPLKERDAFIELKHSVFNKILQSRAETTCIMLPNKGNILYFVGCYDKYVYPYHAAATIKILKKAFGDVAYLHDNEWCCGLPILNDGNYDLAERIAKHNVSAIKASGAKLVITSCPGCYSTLKSEYPKIVEDIPFEVKHISEIIAELIDENKISFKLKINEKVTYHDPCHLGRYEGVYEEPRKILYAIKGIEFVEMLRNKQNAFCCGGGTDLPLINPKLSLSIAKLRVNEAREAGAEAIVTSCPQCVKTLSLAAKTAQIKIFNLPILVVNAMGIRQASNFLRS